MALLVASTQAPIESLVPIVLLVGIGLVLVAFMGRH
jgi:hypothetical protein